MNLIFQDKLLSKLEENEPEMATSQEDEVCKYLFFRNNTENLFNRLWPA